MGAQKQPKPKARERILHLLKTGGPQESAELAELIGVSAMAVRQHLYAFQEKGWVDFHEKSRPMGRPAKEWKLTEKAEQFFPDRHNDLLLNFIDGIEKTLGKESLTKLLKNRAQQQVVDYQDRLSSETQLAHKVCKLAEFRSEEGYMTEVQDAPEGGYLLIENHCPICRAAQACSGLCEFELDVFRQTFGNNVSVDRIEHMLTGERRCVYQIKAS